MVKVKATPIVHAEGCRSLSQLLVYTRARRGWTQRQAVELFKTTPTTYKSWERGAIPRAAWFVRIADFCAVPLERVVTLASHEVDL